MGAGGDSAIIQRLIFQGGPEIEAALNRIG